MMKKAGLIAVLVCSIVTAFAQETSSVEMADTLRSSGRIWVVIVTIVIVFAGLAIYLFALDRRLKRLENGNGDSDDKSSK